MWSVYNAYMQLEGSLCTHSSCAWGATSKHSLHENRVRVSPTERTFLTFRQRAVYATQAAICGKAALSLSIPLTKFEVTRAGS